MPVPLSSYKTPGVYVQEIQKLPPTIAQVETAVPVFIGYTQQAERDGESLIDVPTRVTSMDQYVRWFGGPEIENLTVDLSLTLASPGDPTPVVQAIQANSPLYHEITFRMFYAAQMFFDNGGGICYVISVGSTTGEAGAPATVTYSDLDDAIELLKKEEEPTLIVFPDAVPPTPTGGTSLLSTYLETYKKALLFCNDPKINNYFTIMDVGMDSLKPEDPTTDATAFRNIDGIDIDLLKYGAAYYPFLATSLPPNFSDETVTIQSVTVTYTSPASTDSTDGGTGDGTEESPETETTPTEGDSGSSGGEIEINNGDKLSAIKDSYNQIYNIIKDTLNTRTRLVLPPSGPMAGVYARIDSTSGVFKAPANTSVVNVFAPTTKISDVNQDSLNVDTVAGKSINVIRTFKGIGTLVWGARTLAGNDREWRYISVRRFFNMVEESVKRALFRFVFEPNNPNTWISVRASIEAFLETQWRAGALLGNTPNDAYFVRVGVPDTFSEAEMLDGYMVVEIGMAVVRPAEFIVLKFMHKFELGQ